MIDTRRTAKKMPKRAAVLAAAVLAGAGGLILFFGTAAARSAPSRTEAAGGWQAYRDARLGFAVERPAGWTVKADSRSILVQSPDHSETVLMEVFTASPGGSAEAHLSLLPQEQAALFPQARLSNLAPQLSAGEEVSAALSYQPAGEAGQGRVLCSIVHGKGLMFVLAAPDTGFAAHQPALTRIVKSIRFIVPTGPAHAKTSQGKTAAAGAAAVRALHFVTWTDPREHGFQVSVPQGWKAEGGVFHTGPTDLRIAYAVTSPAKDMQVVIGDPRLPSMFVAPNEMLGAFDGQNGCLHYMQAQEFNHWYLENLCRPVIDNLVIGADRPMPEASRQRTVQAQRPFGSSAEVEVNVGVTEFSGLSKLTHKQISGIVIGSTQRITSRGFGAATTTWVPGSIILTCNDDASKARNQQIVMAVFGRIQQSYQENSAWANRLAQEGAASTEQRRRSMEQNTQQMIAQSRQRSAEITQNSDAARSAIIGAYGGHAGAQSEQQRGFINYMGDRTDVTDSSGTSENVEGGSKHYYKNGQTGNIVGTDSAYSPGIDFTPLAER